MVYCFKISLTLVNIKYFRVTYTAFLYQGGYTVLKADY